MALLDVKGLSKHFSGLIAVENVDFHVDEGEVVSIIGPNGAGKTTIFNLITGVYEVTKGTIEFSGEQIQNRKVQHIVRAGIARTFQNIRLFKNMRSIENVLVGETITTKYNFFDQTFRTPKFHRQEAARAQQAIDILHSIGFNNEQIQQYALRRTEKAGDRPRHGDGCQTSAARRACRGHEPAGITGTAGVHPQS